jgi:hypothetical protein
VGDLPRHPGDAVALAPGPRRSFVDLSSPWSRRSQRSRGRCRGSGAAPGPGEPPLGLSPHRGRVPQARCDRLGHQRAQRAAPSPHRPGTPTIRAFMVTVPPVPGRRHPRVRLLPRRYDHAPARLCAVLHRVRASESLLGWCDRPPGRALGNPASPEPCSDPRRPEPSPPLLGPRPGHQVRQGPSTR